MRITFMNLQELLYPVSLRLYNPSPGVLFSVTGYQKAIKLDFHFKNGPDTKKCFIGKTAPCQLE